MSIFGVKYCNVNKKCQLSPVPPDCEGINKMLVMDVAKIHNPLQFHTIYLIQFSFFFVSVRREYSLHIRFPYNPFDLFGLKDGKILNAVAANMAALTELPRLECKYVVSFYIKSQPIFQICALDSQLFIKFR